MNHRRAKYADRRRTRPRFEHPIRVLRVLPNPEQWPLQHVRECEEPQQLSLLVDVLGRRLVRIRCVHCSAWSWSRDVPKESPMNRTRRRPAPLRVDPAGPKPTSAPRRRSVPMSPSPTTRPVRRRRRST